jgi:anti-sigma factor RsiW
MEMGSPTSPPGPHVLDKLESYLLGGLDHSDEFVVEKHLLRCSVCRDECDDLADAALMVGRLPTSIAREIVEATGPRSVGPVKPGRQPFSVVRSRGRILAVAMAAVLFGVGIGAAGWAWLGPAKVVAVAASNQPVNGLPAQLSVTLAEQSDGSVVVQAVLVGVQPGLDIELLAVTAGQRVISVSRDQAGGGPQQVVGLLPANAGKLLFFIVVDSNHQVLAMTLM